MIVTLVFVIGVFCWFVLSVALGIALGRLLGRR